MKRYSMTSLRTYSPAEDPNGDFVKHEDVLKLIPAYEPPPCECCKQYFDYYVAECDCGNPGDHEAAVRWCVRMEIADSFEGKE